MSVVPHTEEAFETLIVFEPTTSGGCLSGEAQGANLTRGGALVPNPVSDEPYRDQVLNEAPGVSR